MRSAAGSRAPVLPDFVRVDAGQFRLAKEFRQRANIQLVLVKCFRGHVGRPRCEPHFRSFGEKHLLEVLPTQPNSSGPRKQPQRATGPAGRAEGSDGEAKAAACRERLGQGVPALQRGESAMPPRARGKETVRAGQQHEGCGDPGCD